MPRTFGLLFVLIVCIVGSEVEAVEPGAAQTAPNESRRVDLFGDPLPKGAIARLGTLRYRPADGGSVNDTSPDRKLIATGEPGGVRFFERDTGKEVGYVEIDGTLTFSVKFSPDGKHLIALADRNWMVMSVAPGNSHAFYLIDVERRRIISTGNKGWDSFPYADPVFVSSGKRFLLRESNTLHICETATGKPIYSFAEVTAIQLSPDEKVLVAAIKTRESLDFQRHPIAVGETKPVMLMDKSIQVIDFASGKPLHSWAAGDSDIEQMFISQDGRRLLTVTIGKRFRRRIEEGTEAIPSWIVWDIGQRKELCRQAVEPGERVYSFSPDGSVVQIPAANGSVYWDVDAGKQISWQQGKAADQPQTATLANGVRLLAAMKSDGIQQIRATRDAKELWTWNPEKPVQAMRRPYLTVIDERTGIDLADLDGHRQPIRDLLFSPDGKYALTVDDESCLRVWEASTGKSLPTPKLTAKPIRYRFLDSVKQIVVVDIHARVHVWATATGKVESTYPIGDLPTLWNWHEIDDRGRSRFDIHCVFTSDGNRMVVATEQHVEIWDTANGKRLQRLKMFDERIASLSLWNDGKYIMTTTKTDACRLDTIEGKPVWQWRHERGRHEGVVSQNGKYLAYECGDGIQLSNLSTGTKMRKVAGGNGYFSADGSLLATWTGKKDGCIQLWNVETGREVRTIRSPTDANGEAKYYDADFFTAPDGRLVARIRLDGKNSSHALLDVAANRRIYGPWWADEFSPDGRILLTGGWTALQEVATGKEIGMFPREAHRGRTTKLKFTPDGRQVATAGGEATVVMWDWPQALDLLPKGSPTERELLEYWETLAKTDAHEGYRALFGFATAPDVALPCLRARLKPAAPNESKPILDWIADLDADNFTVRELARKNLLQQGSDALPHLRAAALRSPSTEAATQIAKLIDAPELCVLPGERLREIRAVQALEWMNLPQARELLEVLAKGDPTALRTREATAALQRMERRN